MKALLLYHDRDFDLQQPLPWNAHALTQDLELDTLLGAMAAGDEFLLDVARKVLLSGVQNDAGTVLYRQAILRDCLKHPEVVRGLYALAVETIERKRKHWFGIFSHYPSGILHGAIELLQMFAEMLRKLRSIAEEQAGRFESEGFTTLFATLRKELSDDYLASIQTHLTQLRFRRGALISAELGRRNEGVNYVLRKPNDRGTNWLDRLLRKKPPGYTFYIHPRDENGAKFLGDMRDRGINLVANALAQSSDHVLSFFQMLRLELAFYVGCLNLHERLAAKGKPTCFPQPEPAGSRRLGFRGLYDVCLALSTERRVVGNAADADGKSLVIVTGANTGGKSTFLRSIGLAQVMLQSGVFVGAAAFHGELAPALFTHYLREEDATMKRGKLDEELARMSEIADHVAPDSLLLFNESFGATNEREGSEIARQVVSALLEKRVKVFFVTHLYEFAHSYFDRKRQDALFLRAERLPDGTRTFRLVPGEPLETSYGEDLYREVFETALEALRTPSSSASEEQRA
jgi:DNA mismatch repair ATPase MutS